jgi:hypothetical protein
MHTRRLAAFLLGAWLLGSIVVGFLVAPAAFKQVESVLATPPSAIGREIEEVGSDIMRLILRYQASELNRFVFDAWGVIQLGLAAATLSSVVLTAHRSKFLIVVALAMAAIVCIQALYITPSLKTLGRQIDFLPQTANSAERESHQSYHMWYQVLEVLKLLFGVAAAFRLLVDTRDWRDRSTSTERPSVHRRRRRRKRTSDGAQVQPEDIEEESVAEPGEPGSVSRD